MILYGASGHGKVVMEILEESGIIPSFIWDDAVKPPIWSLPVVKPSLISLSPEEKEMIISIGDNSVRKKIAEKYKTVFEFKKAIHPSARISKTSKIGHGSVVMASVVINAEAVVGEHCIINTGAVIEHDCIVGSFAHISPNATLCGNVSVGEGTHVGAGAVIIPGVKIGKWCIIGAGSVIIRDVEDSTKIVGNPGRIVT